MNFAHFGKPGLITELANIDPSVPKSAKGRQYARYYKSLSGWIIGAFVVSASDPTFVPQTWDSENGSVSEIAAAVGA